MVKRVRQHADILRVLQKAKPTLRHSILKQLDKGPLCAICEISENTLSGAVPLSPIQRAKLSKHKAVLRDLAGRHKKLEDKRRALLSQRGGAILPLLLSTILPLVLSKLT